jgi:hypothetical protein
VRLHPQATTCSFATASIAALEPFWVGAFHRARHSQGRDSVVGAQPPAMEVVAKAKHVTVMDHDMKSVMEQFSPDQMKIPRAIVEQWNPQIVDGLPDAFSGIVFVLNENAFDLVILALVIHTAIYYRCFKILSHRLFHF